MATKQVAKKAATKKAAAPKKAAKKAAPKKAAPKYGPKDEFVVIKESCGNLVSRQTESHSDAVATAKENARNDTGEKFIIARLEKVTAFMVPDAVVVEAL